MYILSKIKLKNQWYFKKIEILLEGTVSAMQFSGGNVMEIRAIFFEAYLKNANTSLKVSFSTLAHLNNLKVRCSPCSLCYCTVRRNLS
jgi:hypothetical protein